MLGLWALFAFGDVKDEMDARSRNFFRLDATDALLVLGILVIVALVLFFWAFYVRKRPSEKHGAPILGERPERHNGEPSARRRVRRKRRRHHPDNFPRNPTLGETGGLPPLRSEDEPMPPEGEEETQS